MSFRENCPDREICGSTGHIHTEKGYVRCKCLQLEMNEQKLGSMFCENPAKNSPLIEFLDKNIIISHPLQAARKIISGALLTLLDKKKVFKTIDAYRLIEIHLEKDLEYRTNYPIVNCDLLVILLGFGDPTNKYLPELLLQVLNRRELTRKPTWVLLGSTLTYDNIYKKYSGELQDYLDTFRKVGTK
jgi:hypothetical protein